MNLGCLEAWLNKCKESKGSVWVEIKLCRSSGVNLGGRCEIKWLRWDGFMGFEGVVLLNLFV